MNKLISLRTVLATGCATALVTLIAGCSTPLQTKAPNRPFYAEPERRAPGAAASVPEIITPSYGKVIAVTDIAYKQEFRDFFYDEKASSKSETIEFPAQAKPVTPPAAQEPIKPTPESIRPESALPQHIPDSSPMRNQSSLYCLACTSRSYSGASTRSPGLASHWRTQRTELGRSLRAVFEFSL